MGLTSHLNRIDKPKRNKNWTVDKAIRLFLSVVTVFAFRTLKGIHKTYVVGASEFTNVAYHRTVYSLIAYLSALNEFVCSASDVCYSIAYLSQLWGEEVLGSLLNEKNIRGGG